MCLVFALYLPIAEPWPGRISYKIKMSKYKKPVELSIPESYELGFCTVGKLSEFPFTIFNPNAKPLNYLFKFT